MKQSQKIAAQIAALQNKLKVARQQEADTRRVHTGEVPSPAQAKLMKEQKFSYGVNFLRAKELRRVKSPGTVCVSTRYFATRKEAEHHGKRFMKIHGHRDFTVVVVHKKANAWVNWKTGKTNPAI